MFDVSEADLMIFIQLAVNNQVYCICANDLSVEPTGYPENSQAPHLISTAQT